MTRCRPALFRIVAILVGLSPFLIAELGLRCVSWGTRRTPVDPYVEFQSIEPLFQLTATGDRYETAKSRLTYFQPDSFAANKSQDEFRVFCLGGSTVQGRPYSIETSFTTWLELNLKAADPSRTWNVVNCGGVSYASYRLLPIAIEILRYEPDLVILCTGHNEFLEERSYAGFKRRSKWFKHIHDAACNLHLFQAASRLVSNRFSRKPKLAMLPTEVDALLDYRGGLETYHRDDTRQAKIVAHFQQNLNNIVQAAQQAEVPIWILSPVSNLKGTPPFKAVGSADLTTDQEQAFDRHWNAAKETVDPISRLKETDAALAIDPRHANPHFLKGRITETLGRFSDAKESYVRAKDEDICPLRITESMRGVVQQVARSTDTPMFDLQTLFEDRAPHGIPGDDQLIDHVHPRIEGHQAIADLLTRQFEKRGFASLRDGWLDRRKQLFKQNWRSLPENYFPESVARLEGLRRWTKGRVQRIDPDP